MCLTRMLLSLRRYGVRGVFDWICRRVAGDDLAQRLMRTAITDDAFVPDVGITLIGDMDQRHGSLCKVLYDFRVALLKSGTPSQCYDTSKDMPNGFVINRYTHIIGMMDVPNLAALKHCKLLRIAFWEFESGFLSAYPHFSDGAGVIAMSDFCYESFRAQLPRSISVHKLLYPFSFDADGPIDSLAIRSRFGISVDDFLVFFNFNFNSGYYRKNPEAIVQAFSKAFGVDKDVKLVFKTQGAKTNPKTAARLVSLAKKLGVYDRMVVIDEFLSNDEIVGLTKSCDVYISLHRGEGFGLGVAEAMSLGKPVIVSDYGSTSEFCNCDNSILIPCMKVHPLPEQMDYDNYRSVVSWAEPNIHLAAEALKRLHTDHDCVSRLGARARRFIMDYFSVKNFGKSVQDLLSCRCS